MPLASSRRRAGALGLLVPLALGGCARSCKNDHPYVPYTIGEAGPGPSPSSAHLDEAGAPEAIDGPDASAFLEQAATVIPADATSFPLGGLELAAPSGRAFLAALVVDIDGDGARDALALVHAPGSSDPGELVVYRGSAASALTPPTTLATAPTMPADPSCAPVNRLAQVGPRSVLIEVGVSCAGPSAAIPTRWAAVLTFDPQPRTQWSAILRDPPGEPKLTLNVDGTDRDGDGVDDIALHVTLEGGGAPFEPAPAATAVVRWFDRRAGLSRDPGEPDASLRTLASSAHARAAKARDAATVPLFARQIRALYAALCSDAGASRITTARGVPALSCGASRGVEEAGLAEVRAYTTMGDPLRALAALERTALPPATHTASRGADALGWITQAAPVAGTASLRAIAAVPQVDRGHAPAYGALAFEPNGRLFVRTAAGVVRVDPTNGDEASADGVAPWPTVVAAPDGSARWLDAYDACDGFALHARFAVRGPAADSRDLLLPIRPPLGGHCATTAGHGEAAPALPVAWGPLGLEAVVAGEPILIAPDLSHATSAVASLDQPVSLGAPRSPNGKVLVVPTGEGIFVRGVRPRLHRARELEGGYAELRDCVVSDDAARIACVRGGRAFVGVWELGL